MLLFPQRTPLVAQGRQAVIKPAENLPSSSSLHTSSFFIFQRLAELFSQSTYPILTINRNLVVPTTASSPERISVGSVSVTPLSIVPVREPISCM